MTATPLRNVRVPDEEWGRALARAQSEGQTLSEVVREFLREYGSGPGRSEAPPLPAGGRGRVTAERAAGTV